MAFKAGSGKTLLVGGVKPVKPRRRWRSGIVATREIRKLTKTTDNLFPKAPFERLVRGIADDIRNSCRFTEDAMEAIHEGAEQYVIDCLVKADLARRHARRKTMHVADIRFAKYMTHATSELVGNNIHENSPL